MGGRQDGSREDSWTAVRDIQAMVAWLRQDEVGRERGLGDLGSVLEAEPAGLWLNWPGLGQLRGTT